MREARLWISYALLAWLAGRLLRTSDDRRRLCWAVFIAGVAFAVIGITQKANGARFIYGIREIASNRSPFGPFYNRDHAGGFLVSCGAVGIGLFLSRLGAFRGRRTIGDLANLWAAQSLVLGGLFAIAIGTYMTESRGALHAATAAGWLTAMASTSFISSSRARSRTRAVLVSSFFAYLAAVIHFSHLIGLESGAFDSSTAVRLSIWRRCLTMIADRPLFGFGLGAFQSAFAPYQEGWITGLVEHAHCDWLELLVTTGWVGFTVAAAAGAWHFALAVRDWLRGLDLENRALLSGMIFACLAFLLHGLVEFNLQLPASAALLVVLLAALRPAVPSEMNGGGTYVRSIIGGVVLAVCLVVTSRASIDSLRAWRLAQSRETSPIYDLHRAEALDPGDPRNSYELGRSYLNLADSTASARHIFAMAALEAAIRGLAADPQDPELCRLESEALKRLTRKDDADLIGAACLRGHPWLMNRA